MADLTEDITVGTVGMAGTKVLRQVAKNKALQNKVLEQTLKQNAQRFEAEQAEKLAARKLAQQAVKRGVVQEAEQGGGMLARVGRFFGWGSRGASAAENVTAQTIENAAPRAASNVVNIASRMAPQALETGAPLVEGGGAVLAEGGGAVLTDAAIGGGIAAATTVETEVVATNFWNPVGWIAAGALVVTGGYLLYKHIKNKNQEQDAAIKAGWNNAEEMEDAAKAGFKNLAEVRFVDEQIRKYGVNGQHYGSLWEYGKKNGHDSYEDLMKVANNGHAMSGHDYALSWGYKDPAAAQTNPGTDRDPNPAPAPAKPAVDYSFAADANFGETNNTQQMMALQIMLGQKDPVSGKTYLDASKAGLNDAKDAFRDADGTATINSLEHFLAEHKDKNGNAYYTGALDDDKMGTGVRRGLERFIADNNPNYKGPTDGKSLSDDARNALADAVKNYEEANVPAPNPTASAVTTTTASPDGKPHANIVPVELSTSTIAQNPTRLFAPLAGNFAQGMIQEQNTALSNTSLDSNGRPRNNLNLILASTGNSVTTNTITTGATVDKDFQKKVDAVSQDVDRAGFAGQYTILRGDIVGGAEDRALSLYLKNNGATAKPGQSAFFAYNGPQEGAEAFYKAVHDSSKKHGLVGASSHLTSDGQALGNAYFPGYVENKHGHNFFATIGHGFKVVFSPSDTRHQSTSPYGGAPRRDPQLDNLQHRYGTPDGKPIDRSPGANQKVLIARNNGYWSRWNNDSSTPQTDLMVAGQAQLRTGGGTGASSYPVPGQ